MSTSTSTLCGVSSSTSLVRASRLSQPFSSILAAIYIVCPRFTSTTLSPILATGWSSALYGLYLATGLLSYSPSYNGRIRCPQALANLALAPLALVRSLFRSSIDIIRSLGLLVTFIGPCGALKLAEAVTHQNPVRTSDRSFFSSYLTQTCHRLKGPVSRLPPSQSNSRPTFLVLHILYALSPPSLPLTLSYLVTVPALAAASEDMPSIRRLGRWNQA